MKYRLTFNTLIISLTVFICAVNWVASDILLTAPQKIGTCLVGLILVGIPVSIAAFNDTYTD